MDRVNRFELESPQQASLEGDEDQETLAAIDEGLRDAQERRSVTAEEVRKRLPKWILSSSTRKKH